MKYNLARGNRLLGICLLRVSLIPSPCSALSASWLPWVSALSASWLPRGEQLCFCFLVLYRDSPWPRNNRPKWTWTKIQKKKKKIFPPCISYLYCFCNKVLDKSNLRNEGIISAHSLRVKSFMAKSHSRRNETANISQETEINADDQLIFF